MIPGSARVVLDYSEAVVLRKELAAAMAERRELEGEKARLVAEKARLRIERAGRDAKLGAARAEKMRLLARIDDRDRRIEALRSAVQTLGSGSATQKGAKSATAQTSRRRTGR